LRKWTCPNHCTSFLITNVCRYLTLNYSRLHAEVSDLSVTSRNSDLMHISQLGVAVTADSRRSKKRRLTTSLTIKDEDHTPSTLSPCGSSPPSHVAISPESLQAPSPSYSSSGSESGSPTHSLPTPPDYSEPSSPPAIIHKTDDAIASNNALSSSSPPVQLSTFADHFSQIPSPSSSTTHSKLLSTLDLSRDISISKDYLSTFFEPLNPQPQVASIHVKQEQLLLEDELNTTPSRPPQEQIYIERKRKRKLDTFVESYPSLVLSIPAHLSRNAGRGGDCRPTRDRYRRKITDRSNKKNLLCSFSRNVVQEELGTRLSSNAVALLTKLESDNMDNFRPPKRLKAMISDG
jgi:hypothetical protein